MHACMYGGMHAQHHACAALHMCVCMQSKEERTEYVCRTSCRRKVFVIYFHSMHACVVECIPE